MIDPKTGDQGRVVVYWRRRRDAEDGGVRRAGHDGLWIMETGVVSSWNERYVHVLYDGDRAPKATLREDLRWES